MKLRRWAKVISWLTACFMAGSIALLLCYFGWHAMLDSWKSFLSGALSWREAWPLLMVPFTILLLIAVSIVNVVLGILFRRKVMRPLEKAIAFANAVSRNETPEVLTPDHGSDEDMAALQQSLNVLRDRLQNQLARSRQTSARAIKAGRERDRFESLKCRAFDDILPEARRTLGILKGQLLIQLEEFDRENDPAKQYYRELLLKSIRRQSALARELEAADDINRLDWKRWNEPVSSRFDTADFIYELLESVRAVSRTREVLLVNEISSEIPGRMCADRELLFYLLSVLLRTACRLAAPRSEIVFKASRDERGEANFELHLVLRDRDSQKLAAPERESGAIRVALEIVRTTAKFIGCALDVEFGEERAVFKLSLPAGASIYDRSGVTALPSTSLFAGNVDVADDRPLNVLLLDDEPDGVETLTGVMRIYHLTLTACANEAQLLANLREKSFDAIIIASIFADRAANGLLDEIRAIRRIPVILTSAAFPGEGQRQKDFAGQIAYLPMPLNYELLNDIIRRLCR